jgi:hypothetical protein
MKVHEVMSKLQKLDPNDDIISLHFTMPDEYDYDDTLFTKEEWREIVDDFNSSDEVYEVITNITHWYMTRMFEVVRPKLPKWA